MNDELISRCTLFFEDRESMDRAFRLSDCFTVSACAARLAEKGVSITPQWLKELRAAFRKAVSPFSFLREITPIAVAVMAESEEPEAVIAKTTSAYKALRTKFGASDQTALAALMLAVTRGEAEYDALASAVRAQYDAFKAKHRFRTDRANIPTCTLLALRGADPNKAAAEAEACFTLMRKEHRFRCRWGLAQMLALDPRETAVKCSDVCELRDRLRAERRSVSFYYELASLAFLSDELKDNAPDALAVFDTLSGERKTNGWRLDREQRLMLSYLIVSPSPELFCLALSGHFEKRAAQAAAAAA